MSRLLWMTMFLMENPTQNFVYFSRGEIMDLFKFLDLNNVYLIFAWLTNYSVKLSFLVFFRSLVQGVSGRLNVYWWVVLVITVCSWLFNAIETLAVCGVGDSRKFLILFPQNSGSLANIPDSKVLPVSHP